MKIYALWSHQFRTLRDDWFLRTLPSDMEPILRESTADATPGAGFGSPKWCAALDEKVEFICDAVHNNPNELICVSDIDVQFFGSFREEVTQLMQGHDLAGMREWHCGGLNAGFLILRCTPAVAALWQEILLADKSEAELYDQDALNALLADPEFTVPHCTLPNHYWCSHRALTFQEPMPSPLLVHHATGTKNKAGELKRIRELQAGRS